MSPWTRYPILHLLTLRLQLVVSNTVRRVLPRTPNLCPEKYPIPDHRALRSLLFLRSLSVIRVVLL